MTSTKHLAGVMDLMDPANFPSTDWFCFSTYSGFIGLSVEKVEGGDLVVVALGLLLQSLFGVAYASSKLILMRGNMT